MRSVHCVLSPVVILFDAGFSISHDFYYHAISCIVSFHVPKAVALFTHCFGSTDN